MPVDMFASTFLNKLRSIQMPDEDFTKDGFIRDEEVWEEHFSAWRGVFDGICSINHTAGYGLPSYWDFYDLLKTSYGKHEKSGRFLRYFEEPLLIGMKHRVWLWYESGMAETHLYCCITDAIDDNMKCGVVAYDARLDWKHKCDLMVLIGGRPFIVDSFFGKMEGRDHILMRRGEVERETKRNTMESSHWGHVLENEVPHLRIVRNEWEGRSVNGVRLFSNRSIDALLMELYDAVDISPDIRHYISGHPPTPCQLSDCGV
jgi:hypothetical protein